MGSIPATLVILNRAIPRIIYKNNRHSSLRVNNSSAVERKHLAFRPAAVKTTKVEKAVLVSPHTYTFFPRKHLSGALEDSLKTF